MLVLEFHFSPLSYPGKVPGRLDRKEIKGLMTSRHGLLIHDLSIYSNRWKICFCLEGKAFLVLNGERGCKCTVSFRKAFTLTLSKGDMEPQQNHIWALKKYPSFTVLASCFELRIVWYFYPSKHLLASKFALGGFPRQ